MSACARTDSQHRPRLTDETTQAMNWRKTITYADPAVLPHEQDHDGAGYRPALMTHN
ncbi:hypothetical protein [Phaeobacter sp. C3_T13_0]|uniref:hypothetical protein n=1 Tax=Phaeobacter cretensis TaxID=3342641 RepID=UPI0039BD8ED6